MTQTANATVTYQPRPTATPAASDLLLLEQKSWSAYCGILTRANLVKYLRNMYFGEAGAEEDEETEYVTCCGSGDIAIPIHAYELREGVAYRLRTTAGTLDEPVLEDIREKESVTFSLETEASIRHPATAIIGAKWLTGPWTTGGAAVAAPALAVSGRTVTSPIPLFGSVELTLQVRRWRHVLHIPKDEAEALLLDGWAEFVVGLPEGGRPVGLEIAEPPGAAELARTGLPCGRGRGGGSGRGGGGDDTVIGGEGTDYIKSGFPAVGAGKMDNRPVRQLVFGGGCIRLSVVISC